MSVNTLTPPAFVETSPGLLVEQLVQLYQTVTGKTLYPAQIERLLVDFLAYRESLVRQAIQRSAEQNLVDFANGDRLEALGRLVGVNGRLPAVAASTTWTITLQTVDTVATTFAKGFRAAAQNGSIWQTTADVVIPAGQLSAAVMAQALVPGDVGNGIPSGSSFSPLSGTATITSASISSGGSDAETDDQLRGRILLAPFGFSVAGSEGAYKFHAMSAHSSIIDVAVLNLGSGMVGVYPLCDDGLPSTAVKNAVTDALSAETVRPLCDIVDVSDPTRVAYTLEANVTTYASALTDKVLDAVNAAALAYCKDRAAGLGRDLVGSQAIKALSVEGVYSVQLLNWTDRVLASNAWADGTVSIHFSGSQNG
jgi:phage-related baseplate assembly protein